MARHPELGHCQIDNANQQPLWNPHPRVAANGCLSESLVAVIPADRLGLQATGVHTEKS